MIKKMVVLAVVGFVAVTAVGGTKLGSYIRSEWKAARQQAEDGVPPEKEIARLKNEVALLDGDIKKLINHLAKERVEVKLLGEKVDEMTAQQGKDKDVLAARLEKIEAAEKTSAQTVSFGTGRPQPLDTARADLAQSLTRFETNKKSLAAHEVLLANRTKVRDTLEKQLDTMKNQKSELSNQVNAMEAELAALKLQQMESKYQTDDTRMARIKEDLQKLKTKVAVEREKLALQPAAHDDAPTSSAPTTEELKARLNGAKKPDATKTETKMPPAID